MSAAAFSSVASFSLKDPSLLIQKPPPPSSLTTTTIQDEDQSLKIFDPATATAIATIRATNLQETKDTINRSKEALPSWKDGTIAMKRSRILYKWNDMIKDNADDLGKLHPIMIFFNGLNSTNIS